VLEVTLYVWLINLATDEALRVKDRVGGIRMECIFRRVTNPSCGVRGVRDIRKKKSTHSRSSSVKATQEGVIR
jgi:hypothetical protein